MDFEVVRKAMTECKVFDDFDEFQQGLLAMLATSKGYKAGDTIYAQDTAADDTFALIVSGAVTVVRDESEIDHWLRRGEIIGEIGIVSPQSKRTCTVMAAEDTDVLEWRFEVVGEKLPELRKRLKDLAWEHISGWAR